MLKALSYNTKGSRNLSPVLSALCTTLWIWVRRTSPSRNLLEVTALKWLCGFLAEAEQRAEIKESTNGRDLLIAGTMGLRRGLKLAELVGL